MSDPFASPTQNRVRRAEKPKPGSLFEKAHDEENAQTLESQENQKKKSNTGIEIERVTKLKLVIFTLYTLSLMVVMQLRVEFDRQIDVNTARNEFYLNQIVTQSGYIKRESLKPAFKDVNTISSLTNYITSTIIDGIYADSSGEVIDRIDTNAEMILYQVVSTLRIKQKRAKIIREPEKKNFPKRWNLDESLEETAPYGTNATNKILYDLGQEGYLINIRVPYQTRNESRDLFDQAINNGFFDEQTRDIQLDFVEYDGTNNYLVYFKLKFLLSPTGRITTFKSVTTFPILYYNSRTGLPMFICQIIFVVLFVYFSAQEAIKIYNHIRSFQVSKESDGQDDNGRLAQVAAGAKNFKEKLMSILKGILNHIKNPWSFIDIISLICSLLDILLWLDVVEADTAKKLLDISNPHSQSPFTVQAQALDYFNQAMEDTTKKLILFRHIAAVNLLILIIKLLKYITRLNQQIKDEVQVVVNIINRLIPFIVLFLTILISFVYMVFFLFGHTVIEFSSFFSALQYLFTAIHGQFKSLKSMYDYNPTYTLVFHILFIFIIIFILQNMFLVYVIHAFQDYIDAKRSQKKLQDKIADQSKFEPYILWKIKNFFRVELRLFYLRVIRSKRYDENITAIKEQQLEEKKDLNAYPHFDFDVDIQSKDTNSNEMNSIFNTEEKVRKLKKTKKMELVKSIWKTLAMCLLFIIMTVVAMEHHKVSEAQNITKDISELLDQESLIFIQDNIIKKYNFGRGLQQLKDFNSIFNWIYLLFPRFARPGDITLKGNETYQGYFFPGEALLIAQTYRLTLRKRTQVLQEDGLYKGLSKVTLSRFFEAGAVNPPGENTDPIIGAKTGNSYNYTKNGGYMNAGGYVFTADPEKITSGLNSLALEGIFNSQINSAVLEYILFPVKTKNLVKVSLVFQINEGFAVDTKVNLDFIGVSYYEEGYQIVIGILEVIIMFWTVFILYQILSRLKRNSYYYNYWYSLHVSHFHQNMKAQREKKKPEFLRKICHMFDFNNIINILISLFVLASAALWIYYLVNVTQDSKEVKKFINGTSSLTYGNLLMKMNTNHVVFSALRLAESISLMLLSIKILYYYSHFPKFHFLTGTIRKSVRVTPYMAIITIFILFAFGFFLQLVRGTSDKNFSNALSLSTHMLQMLNKLGDVDIKVLTENNNVFLTLLFYFPWVLFAFCVVYNMFLGIILSAYRSVRPIKNQEEQKLNLKEFFVLTHEILTKKQSSQPQKIHFEVSEQIKSKFNFLNGGKQIIIDLISTIGLFNNINFVFDMMGDMTEIASDYDDVNLWSTACTQLIVNESRCRETMKRISKEITKASIIDFDFNKHEHKKILTDQEKFSQFDLRFKHWRYFMYGRTKLLEYMHSFSEELKGSSHQMGDIRALRLHQKVDLQIQKYIFSLEEAVSKNIRDVQLMKSKLEEYAVVTEKKLFNRPNHN